MSKQEIYCIDVIKGIQKLPHRRVDLIVTDPPYNISSDKKIWRGGLLGKGKDINYDFGKWDHSLIEPSDWIPHAVEILKAKGILITMVGIRQAEEVMQILEEEGMFIRHLGAWVKTNPVPQMRKVKWQSGLELFVIATNNKGAGHHYNPKEGEHSNVIITPICMPNERLDHPTQKPLALVESLVRWWSFEGDLVVDPFVGVGTAAVVCRQLNRNFIGFDNNPEYVRRAKERLSKVGVRQNLVRVLK